MPDTPRTQTQVATSAMRETPALNFAAMLGGLLVLLLVGPLVRTFVPDWSPAILWSTVGLAMAALAWSLAHGVAVRIAGCVVGAAFTCVGGLGNYLAIPALQWAAAIALLVFCLWAIASSLRQVLLGEEMDLNRIFGAVCVFLLMGVAWAVCYVLIALGLDDSFHGLAVDTMHDLWSDAVYFSFVTLTTLGYGDISPVVPIAQTLAFLEAATGQLYIAILIAGLVGAYMQTR